MTDTITWSSGGSQGILGKAPISLQTKNLDYSTSLTLIGTGVANYGPVEQQNFIHLLENFASVNAPANATIGQTWFNPSDATLYVCVDPLQTLHSTIYYPTGQIGWMKVSSTTASEMISVLGYTPYNASNPAGYISGITSASIAAALGYTPQASLGYTPINKSGDSMVGPLTLANDPVSPLHAASKQYVDLHGVTSITAGANISISGSTGNVVISSTGGGGGGGAAVTVTEYNAGSIVYFASQTPPTGYLAANGANVSRATYAELFAAIGTKFGVGDGSTTFTLPDLRGEFVRGWDNGRGIDPSRIFGSLQTGSNLSHTHAFATGIESGTHTHGVNDPGHTHAVNPSSMFLNSYYSGHDDTVDASNTVSVYDRGLNQFPLGTSATGISINTQSANHTHSGTTNADGGSETRPRNIALLACIKAFNSLMSSSGTVTSVTVNGAAGRISGGGTITAAGTVSLDLAASGVTAGSYPFATVAIDSYGRVTSASSNTPVTSVTVNGTGALTGTGTVTSTGSINLDMATIHGGGTFTNATVTLDGHGRVTSAVNGPSGSGLGYDQTWTTYAIGSARANGATYTNSTGKPILVIVTASGSSASGAYYQNAYVNGVAIIANSYGGSTGTWFFPLSFIVPAGATYSVLCGYVINSWSELR